MKPVLPVSESNAISPDRGAHSPPHQTTLLDVIPVSLFRMLCSPAHVRNVAVLERIFDQFFDDFAFAPKKLEVLQLIKQVLEKPEYRGLSDDGEDVGPSDTAGHVIYNRLRSDGWIMEVVNRRATEVHMPREAHALLSSLMTLKEELRVDISAESSLIDTGVLAAYQDPAGKIMNIASARRQAIQLRRSVDGVLTSLYRIEEDLMRSGSLADLLAKFMERFVEKLLLENYRALKTSAYNPMRFQRSILVNTEHFMNDDAQIARAAVTLVDQKVASDMAAAEMQIRQDLTRIRDVFAGLSEKLDHIDRFSHKLERRIATTVRYQETARNVREERLREAIRMAFGRWNDGDNECVTPLVDIPVPYSTTTLAIPKKAREPVEPQTRRPKTIDPADFWREKLMDEYAAAMDITARGIAERLQMIATGDKFFDLDQFEPESARDIAILYEVRAGTFEFIPGIEVRNGISSRPNRYVSGPNVQIRRRESGS
nr:Wadjet anti-phage system protein JetA family protein [Nitrosomonas nitrosa]